jgi:hypothetical protein
MKGRTERITGMSEAWNTLGGATMGIIAFLRVWIAAMLLSLCPVLGLLIATTPRLRAPGPVSRFWIRTMLSLLLGLGGTVVSLGLLKLAGDAFEKVMFSG